MENSNSENRVLETETTNEIKNPIKHEINPILNNLLVKIDHVENRGDDSLLDLQEPLKDEYPEYLKSKLNSNNDEDFANQLSELSTAHEHNLYIGLLEQLQSFAK